MLEADALSGSLEESFARRLAPLPDDTRRLLLIAGQLLRIGERVTFRHPLVRSALYRSAAVEDRRTVHAALAEATDHNVDPDP